MAHGRLAGKRAIITGGASGIGAAAVRRFVAEGARVFIGDLNAIRADQLRSELPSGSVNAAALDVSDKASAAAFVQTASAWLGGLDILFNNAGMGIVGTTPQMDPDDWRKVFAVNTDSLFYMCRVAIPIMATGGGGAIVNTASISGLRGDQGSVAYSAAKAASINYTRALAVDHAADNIRVNAICPGLVDTPLTEGGKALGMWDAWTGAIPMRRAGTPEEIANVALFLASDEASFMTGSIVVADGGKSAGTGQPDLRQVTQ